MLCTQAIASAPAKRKRSRITRSSPRTRRRRCPPPVQPQVLAVPPSATTTTSSSSTAKTSAPVTTAPPTNTAPLYVTFDPLQVALETFDKVVSSSQPSNMSIAVSTHIYRALFKQFVSNCTSLYPQPITPSDLINATLTTLKALGLA